jgi:hypothetical protein
MNNEQDFNNKFDDFFRDKLNEVPNFPRQQENWEKVSAAIPSKKIGVSLYHYWWLLPFLLLLGWNGCQMCALQQIQTDNNLLKTDNLLLKTSIHHLETQLITMRDTVWQVHTIHHTIYHTDTIYQKRYLIDEIFMGNNAKYSDAARLNPSFFANLPDKIAIHNEPITQQKDTLHAQGENITPSSNEKNKSNENLTLQNTQKNEPDTTSTVLASDNSTLKDTTSQAENPQPTVKKVVNPIKQPTVTEIRLGIQANYTNLIPPIVGMNTTNALGGEVNFSFNPQFRLTGSAAKSSLHFKITELPQSHNPFHLPMQPTFVEPYQLGYIESTITSWELGLGAQYLLLPAAKVRPFLAGGYTRQVALPYEVEFESKNMLTKEEKSVKIPAKGFNDHWWHIGAGVETTLARNLEARVLVGTLYDANNRAKSLNYWLVRLGVFYQLK